MTGTSLRWGITSGLWFVAGIVGAIMKAPDHWIMFDIGASLVSLAISDITKDKK